MNLESLRQGYHKLVAAFDILEDALEETIEDMEEAQYQDVAYEEIDKNAADVDFDADESDEVDSTKALRQALETFASVVDELNRTMD